MEIQLPPGLQSRLAHLAQQQGRDSTALVTEAIERLISHEERFLSEVEQGVAAADRGDFVQHETVLDLISSRYPG